MQVKWQLYLPWWKDMADDMSDYLKERSLCQSCELPQPPAGPAGLPAPLHHAPQAAVKPADDEDDPVNRTAKARRRRRAKLKRERRKKKKQKTARQLRFPLLPACSMKAHFVDLDTSRLKVRPSMENIAATVAAEAFCHDQWDECLDLLEGSELFSNVTGSADSGTPNTVAITGKHPSSAMALALISSAFNHSCICRTGRNYRRQNLPSNVPCA